MQYPIGDHALLADGRTAALIDPSGNVAWLCWPRIDSMPCLFSILDDHKGGYFVVAPAHREARVVSRRYIDTSLVLETVWQVGASQLIVRDALSWDTPLCLVRELSCTGPPVDVVVRCVLAFDAGRGDTQITVTGTRAHFSSTDNSLALGVHGPEVWKSSDTGVISSFCVTPDTVQCVLLTAPEHDVQHQNSALLIPDTLEHWRTVHSATTYSLSSLAQRHSPAETGALVALSTSVLHGLHQRGGGIVAAPTTSLPQWPGSSRTWDYRYSWLRDSALAALALVRVGLHDDAREIGDFLGRVIEEGLSTSLVRVDGTTPPTETTLDHLSGYHGARPVRIGNGAATQFQLDVIGEVVELGVALAANHLLPDTLRRALPLVTQEAATRWREPDYGIWEIRGEAQQYTHSKVMAWTALTGAAQLARNGLIDGDAGTWEREASALHQQLLSSSPNTFQLRTDGGGPDASLAQIGLMGFLPSQDERVHATLRTITENLNRNGLIDRYVDQPDNIPFPCAPFIFPTFWIAQALQESGADGCAYFSAALSTRGSLGLFGEVADPRDMTPLGNYPQVQSHAALILAATTL